MDMLNLNYCAVYLMLFVQFVWYSKSKIFKFQSTLRTSWNKKVEEKARNKNTKDFERNLKDAKKKMLEVSEETQREMFHLSDLCYATCNLNANVKYTLVKNQV